jgi:hypothetical protein
MKPKLCSMLWIGLFCLALLTGCVRGPSGSGNSAGRPATDATNPPAQIQATPASLPDTWTPAAAMPVQPIQTQPAAVDPTAQPTITAPAAAVTAVPDVSNAADDLSNSFDGLMKDLNSDDNLNDVK